MRKVLSLDLCKVHVCMDMCSNNDSVSVCTMYCMSQSKTV